MSAGTESSEGSTGRTSVVRDDAFGGHWWGNFQQYYNFHSVHERTVAAASTCEYMRQGVRDTAPIFYIDIGCNAGNLTNAIFQRLHGDAREIPKKTTSIHALGVDIDSGLIKRANDTFGNNDQWSCGSSLFFIEGDVLEPEVWQRIDHWIASVQPLPSSEEARPRVLMTVFSTTMWLHLHGGDAGLIKFFQQAIDRVDVLLVEPQPWKCYRNARQRLRKRHTNAVPFPTEISIVSAHSRKNCTTEQTRGSDEPAVSIASKEPEKYIASLLESLECTPLDLGPGPARGASESSDDGEWGREVVVFKAPQQRTAKGVDDPVP